MSSPLPVSTEARLGTDPIDRETLAEFMSDNPKALEEVSVLVLIPAYNEERNIAKVASVISSSIGDLKAQTVVVSDGSTDNTVEMAKEAGLLVCAAPINRGQGAALKLGYKVACLNNIPIVAVVDADGQWNPSDLELMVKMVRDKSSDFVQGSRVLGHSEVGDPIRDLGVKVFARLISFLTKYPITDTSSGIRVLRTELLDRIRLEEPQYQSSELLISAIYAGATVTEHPVVMSKRHTGKSKKGNNLKYGLNYARVVFSTWIRERFVVRG
jgi:glycosyltransferase involved in cell wall biosynthesis